jgi:Fe-Mn family superoxide dismutase
MASLDKVPEEIRMKVRNNLGGVLNHNLFWQIMAPNTKYEILNTKFGKELVKTFGSMEAFQEKFAAAALGRFGSGWVWLSINSKGQLEMSDTPNQDNPIMEGKEPILGLDVWEHAYYLKYQNRRAEYIKNWWNVVNWPEVEERYVRATEQ